MGRETLDNLQQLERGIYADAAREGMSLTDYLQKLGDDGKISASLFDPNAVKRNGEKASAFEQILHHAGIGFTGKRGLAAVGDTFFTDPAKRTLFPEFISNIYRVYDQPFGNRMIQLSDIVTLQTPVNASSYKGGFIARGEKAKAAPARVVEGGQIGFITITESEKDVPLYKYGVGLKMTYERMKRLKLNSLRYYIGLVQLAANEQKLRLGIAALLNGDGNANPAINSATAGASWTLGDIVDLDNDTMDYAGTAPRILLADKTEYANIAKLGTVIADASTSEASRARDEGGPIQLWGYAVKRAIPGSVLDASKKAMTVDPNNALEWVYDPSMDLVETDKIIDEQIERIVFTEQYGFVKIDPANALTKTRP